MAGRKVFTSGEILTASDVNSFLMDQVVAVFSDDAARSSAIPSPSEGMVTFREDQDVVEVFDGSAFTPIGNAGIGSNVVQTVKTDAFALSSTGYTDITGLSVTITPTLASSRILLIASLQMSGSSGSGRPTVRLLREATELGTSTAGSELNGFATTDHFANNDGRMSAFPSIQFLDNPATTSPTTYKIQISQTTGSVQVNRSARDVGNGGSSFITAIEVAG